MIIRIDIDIGVIIQKLKEESLDEKTIVIFTNDNGSEMNYSSTKYFDSNSVFRGKGRDLYEGGIRTPFIARWSGKISFGTSMLYGIY